MNKTGTVRLQVCRSAIRRGFEDIDIRRSGMLPQAVQSESDFVRVNLARRDFDVDGWKV